MLSERTRRWDGERRRAIALEAAATAGCWGFAGAGALALADRAFALPQAVRLAAWAAGALALLAHAGLAYLRWRADAWEELFEAAGDAWPATRPLLGSAWALAATPEREGVSSSLRAAHLAAADALAAQLPAEPLYVWKPSLAARRGGIAAALVLGLNALWGDSAAWARALMPWTDVALERYVEARPGDARLDWGRPAAVSARPTPQGVAAGARPGAVRLQVRGADRRWREAAWERVDEEQASLSIPSLDAPFEYRLSWRGLPGRSYTLTPAAPPRWSSLKAVVRAPRGEREFRLGEASAVRARGGDWVTVSGLPEEELASSVLRVSASDAPIAMRKGADGAWSATFLAAHDASLTLDPEAADGRRDPAPPSYQLLVTADEAPKAELLSPQMPLQASSRDLVPVAYAARDDGALTGLALVRQDGGGAQKRIALPLGDPPGAEAVGDHELTLRGLAPGTVVEFWIEARDDGSPPRTGRSVSGRVEVVDFERAHKDAQEAADDAFRAIGKAASSAEAAAAADRSGDPAKARAAHDQLARDWRDASAALKASAAAQEKDAQANPGLAEQQRRLADALAKAGESGLPRAAKAQAAGDLGKAEREHAALASQARGAEKTLAEASIVQQVQDMDGGAENAERDARQLAEAVNAAAQSGKATPEQLKRLAESLDAVEKQLDALRKAIAALPQAPPEMDLSQVRSLPMDGAKAAADEMRQALQSGDVAAAAKAAQKLAKELEKMRQKLSGAGRGAAEQHGRRQKEGASAVRKAWQKAVEEQGRAVEAERRAEDARDAGLLAAQKKLLAETAAELRRLLDEGPAKPNELPGREALESALAGLRAGKPEGASSAMRSSAGSLRVQAGRSAAGAAPREQTAKSLDALADKLDQGAPRPAASPEAAAAAAAAQRSAKESIAALRGEVEHATRQLGFAAAQARQKVDDAHDEASQSAGALEKGDTAEGLKRGEAALAALQDGESDASGAGEGSESMGESMSSPFGSGGGTVRVMPGSGSGSTGAATGRVRLPRADEYRPPRQLREELERARSEPRPPARDESVKEYFRRLSR